MTIVSAATAKYSGGSGTAEDPYQIATAADLIALGETPADYDKHFLLTADIDLDPNLPGRKVFDRAVIAPDTRTPSENFFGGRSFIGVFNGNGHTISHLTIRGGGYLGLFGQLGESNHVGHLKNLGLVNANISGSGTCIGGLAGSNWGDVTRCYSSGMIRGRSSVGGLVGDNYRPVAQCYSTAVVTGWGGVGGLVGGNWTGNGCIVQCYSTSRVDGNYAVGALAGSGSPGSIVHSVWIVETPRRVESSGGVGLTTTEMMDPYMLGLNGFGGDPNWVLDAGRDYPRLAWEGTPGRVIPEPDIGWLEGHGTAEAPYRIDRADQLVLLGRASILWDKCFVLGVDIDLDPNLPGRHVFAQAVIPGFMGVFDGSDHTISHLTIKGRGYLGLFGQLGRWDAPGSKVKNLGLVDVNLTGSGNYYVGALAGQNWDSVTHCYSTGAVSGGGGVGGLVGYNESMGIVTACHSASAVNGGDLVGGLVGSNWGALTHCYSNGTVGGDDAVGGLVGFNIGAVTQCYSTGAVSGNQTVGGLVGPNTFRDAEGTAIACFWDTQTSGQTESAGGTGRTTAEMRTASTFLLWGTCGNEGIWTIDEGRDYPRLSWENRPGEPIVFAASLRDLLTGEGTEESPYLICASEELNLLALFPCDLEKHFRLVADIDLDPNLPGGRVFHSAVIALRSCGTPFTGVFDGDSHVISHLTIRGGNDLGLFDWLGPGSEVRDIGVVDVNIVGSGISVGALAAFGAGDVTRCYTTGTISGDYAVGGLVAGNAGNVMQCASTVAVTGKGNVGGLVGNNYGRVIESYGTGTVSGTDWGVGGLVGYNDAGPGIMGFSHAATDEIRINGLEEISYVADIGGNGGFVACCYSTSAVTGTSLAGGLVGEGDLSHTTESFWDVRTSGQTKSYGGTGKTTAEMQTAKMFLDAGWDFVGETANGTEDIWWIREGKDYPRLWWELPADRPSQKGQE